VTLPLRHSVYASLLLALCFYPELRGQTTLRTSFEVTPSSTYSTSTDEADDLPVAPSSLQQAATQQAPPPNETPEQKKAREAEGEAEVKKQEKQRVGGVLPLFNVVIAGKTVPLTAKQKLDLSFHTIIDPYTFGLAIVVGGGFGELEGSHPGYGWGPAGLGKRIGANYADNASGNLIGNAILPILFHQDPRYYRKGEGSVLSRIVYSAMTSFICYGDNGKKQFNFSNIAGNVAAGGLSNLYYPRDERGFTLSLENAATVTYEGMFGAQILEFSPDLVNYVHRRREHHRQMLAAQASAAKQGGSNPAPGQPPTPPPAPPQ